MQNLQAQIDALNARLDQQERGYTFPQEQEDAIRERLGYFIQNVATVDFGVIAGQTSSTANIEVPQANVQDTILLMVPSSAQVANTSYSAWVSAAGVVALRCDNNGTSLIDPGSSEFIITILRPN